MARLLSFALILCNLGLLLLGVFALVRAPSHVSAGAFLLLAPAGACAIWFLVRTRRSALPGAAVSLDWPRLVALLWSAVVLAGMVVPFMLKNPVERAALLAPIGAIAALNSLTASLPGIIGGARKAIEEEARAAQQGVEPNVE